MFHCSIVPIFQYSNVPMFKCFNVSMFQCSNVLMFRCSNAQMFKCFNVLMFWCSIFQMFICSNFQMSNVKLQMSNVNTVPPVIFSFFHENKYFLVSLVCWDLGLGHPPTPPWEFVPNWTKFPPLTRLWYWLTLIKTSDSVRPPPPLLGQNPNFYRKPIWRLP